jgi:hypothetical protein
MPELTESVLGRIKPSEPATDCSSKVVVRALVHGVYFYSADAVPKGEEIVQFIHVLNWNTASEANTPSTNITH